MVGHPGPRGVPAFRSALATGRRTRETRDVVGKAPEPMAGRRARGLSLVEALLAGVLVAVTLLPLYDVFMLSERGQLASVERLQAVQHAADLLETLKAVPHPELPLTREDGMPEGGWPDHLVADRVEAPAGRDLGDLADLGVLIRPVTGRVEGFERSLSIRPISRRGDGAGLGDVVRIEVTVRWAEAMSKDRRDETLRVGYLHTPDPDEKP